MIQTVPVEGGYLNTPYIVWDMTRWVTPQLFNVPTFWSTGEDILSCILHDSGCGIAVAALLCLIETVLGRLGGLIDDGM
jgi:hypothetical protein